MTDKKDPIFSSYHMDGVKEYFADPQHFEGDDDEERHRTGEKHPLPTKNAEAKKKLEDLETELKNVKSELKKVEIAGTPKINVDNWPDTQKTENKTIEDKLKDLESKMSDIYDKMDKIIDDDNNVRTQLYGSLIEEEVILKRKSRNEDESKKIDVPERAKGVIFQCNANAMTGEFGEGEGYGMRVRSLLDSNPTTINWWRDISVGRAEDPHQNFVVVWYLGTNDDFIGDASYGNKETKIVSLPLPPFFYLTLRASGEFEDGEGISNELKAFWYY